MQNLTPTTVAIFVCILGGQNLARGADVLIPCKRGGLSPTQSLGLRECPLVISDLTAKLGGTGDPLKPGLIQQQINGYYAGLIESPIIAGTEFVTRTQKMITPFCNLIAGKFNASTREVDKNHKIESCGNYAEIKVEGLGNVTIDLTSGRGSWEESHIRGGFIQAVNCSYQQVLNELNQKSGITLSETCAALGEDIQNLGTQADAVAAKIESELVGQQNVTQIESCAVGADPTGQSSIQQSACLLQAGRARLETAFTYFASCEIMSRARASYRHHFVDDLSGLTGLLQTKVADPCESRCKSECSTKLTKLKSCAEACAKSCYKPLIQKTLEDKINSLWPNSGVCAGFLIAGRRRRRRESLSRRSWFPLLALGLALTMGPACSNKIEFDAPCRAVDLSTISDPLCCASLSCGYLEAQYGIKTDDKSNCEDYGVPLPDMTLVPSCAVTPADEAVAEESALDNGAGSAGAAEAAIGAANGLISGGALSAYDPTSEVGTSDALPNTSAAIAKTTANPTTKSGAGLTGDGAGPKGAGNTKESNSGQNSGSTGQAGQALNLGSTGTSPSAIGIAATEGGSPGAESGASYQGAGTGSGALVYGGGTGGGGGGGIEGSGSTVTELSAGVNGAGGDVAGTPDPEDYFTRVGLEDDLFKIVEKRYRATTTAWIQSDLAHIPGKKRGR
ncbi:MAG: hypothetical protein AAB425_14340 [Bdellovibrionota bacterium]